MTKEAEIYCEACVSVDNGQYLKANFCKLRKIKKILNGPIPDDLDKSPASIGHISRLTDKLNTEIERRKHKFQSLGLFIVKYFLAPLTVLTIWFFAHQYFENSKQQNQKTIQPKIQQQQLNRNQGSIPSKDKGDQQTQKTK